MDKEKAGVIIRIARIKKGLTQAELARKLNVTQWTVGGWEIGNAFPKPKNMVTLCELLEIPVDRLIKAG